MKFVKLIKSSIPSGKRIGFEDDIVVVYDEKGSVIYKGIEDYEPMKDENWKWVQDKGYYTLDNKFIKVCLEI